MGRAPLAFVRPVRRCHGLSRRRAIRGSRRPGQGASARVGHDRGRADREAARRAALQMQQYVQQGQGVFAAGESQEDAVAGADHVVPGDGPTRCAQQIFGRDNGHEGFYTGGMLDGMDRHYEDAGTGLQIGRLGDSEDPSR